MWGLRLGLHYQNSCNEVPAAALTAFLQCFRGRRTWLCNVLRFLRLCHLEGFKDDGSRLVPRGPLPPLHRLRPQSALWRVWIGMDPQIEMTYRRGCATIDSPMGMESNNSQRDTTFSTFDDRVFKRIAIYLYEIHWHRISTVFLVS